MCLLRMVSASAAGALTRGAARRTNRARNFKTEDRLFSLSSTTSPAVRQPFPAASALAFCAVLLGFARSRRRTRCGSPRAAHAERPPRALRAGGGAGAGESWCALARRVVSSAHVLRLRLRLRCFCSRAPRRALPQRRKPRPRKCARTRRAAATADRRAVFGKTIEHKCPLGLRTSRPPLPARRPRRLRRRARRPPRTPRRRRSGCRAA